MKTSLIKDKSFEFALKIIKFTAQFKAREFMSIANQLFRSGTSIGANVEEALGGSSKKDFINKMTISLKEARESNYWLRLIHDSKIIDHADVEILLRDSIELIKILGSIVKTSKSNLINSPLTINS